MVSINIISDKKSRYLELNVKGHAGMAEAGKDLVCAAVSILTYTVAQSLSNMLENKLLAERPRIVLKSGDAEISCRCKAHSFNKVENAFKFARTGYTLLVHSYPQFVELNVNGEAIKP
jgi:uncharacterized protein YsxB (DUF464 family)